MYKYSNHIITVNITTSWQCHLDNEHRALYENFSEEFKKRNIVGEDLAAGSEASILSLLHLNPKDITTIEVRIKRFFKEVSIYYYYYYHNNNT